MSQQQSPRSQSTGYCPHCEERMRLLQDGLDMGVTHILLACVTAALWFIPYFLFFAPERPYRCHKCGTVVEPDEEVE